MNTITPKQLHELVESGGNIELVDVRTPAEFREAHVAFAWNLPLDKFDAAQWATRPNGATDPVYFICRTGNRSGQACEKLRRAGMKDGVNVVGGMRDWLAAGLPVVRGQKTIALERQVRIAAGSLVLVGAVLGLAVHPFWIGLSAIIGAGLVFSGVTDTCGMGMLLARAPWNQVNDPAATATATTTDSSAGVATAGAEDETAGETAGETAAEKKESCCG